MKNSFSSLDILLWLSVFLSTSIITSAQTGTLVIKIKNIKPIEGNLVIGIFDNKENFPIDGKQYKLTTLKVTATEMIYMVELPSKKDYGLAIFHDRNANGIIDKTWLGIPIEPYGFSNNIRPTISAPTFEQVKFKLDQSKNIEVILK